MSSSGPCTHFEGSNWEQAVSFLQLSRYLADETLFLKMTTDIWLRVMKSRKEGKVTCSNKFNREIINIVIIFTSEYNPSFRLFHFDQEEILKYLYLSRYKYI